MDQKLVDELKKRLQIEKQGLEEQLRSFAKRDRRLKGDWDTKFPNFDTARHPLEDEADEVEEFENLLPLERALESKLQEVELALNKISINEFGGCEKCQREIETARLFAVPSTQFCLRCKK